MIYHISTVHISTDSRLQKYLKSSIQMKLICLNRGEKPSDNVIFLMKYRLLSRAALIFLMPLCCLRYIDKGDVVVIHDPELIFTGLILKVIYRKGIKLIFDAHENILQDIRHKYWLNAVIRNFAYLVFSVVIKRFLPKYDMITTVTTPLVEEYSKYNKYVKLLPNLPLSKIEQYEINEKKNSLI